MVGGRILLLLCCWGAAHATPLPQVYVDTPSPPVILEEGDQYAEGGVDQYVDYEYSSLVENELRDIHTRLFSSKDGNSSSSSGPAVSNRISELEKLTTEHPEFSFEPVGVEITAVVSHSPSQDPAEDKQNLRPAEDKQNQETEYRDTSPSGGAVFSDPVVKEKVDELTLRLDWWQILLLLLASLLLASLCCYFSGCCFLTADCCSDPFWGCCPCCRACVRLLKPPPQSPSGTKERAREAKAPSSYSLNENHTAPRSSIERQSSSVSRLEGGTSRSVELTDQQSNGPRTNGSMKTSTPMKPERRTSKSSVKEFTQDGSLGSVSSRRSVRNYRRLSQTNNSSQGLGRTNSSGLDSSRLAGRADDSLRRGRQQSSARGELSEDWVYEDSSGYFSWISKLGSRKKQQYQIHTRKQEDTSSQSSIYRQSKYRHIAESRNSAVIPVKLSKRDSNASNILVRPVRCRSVESLSSDEDTIQPFLHTKSERHLPSRLSTNLADLESRRARRQSGCSTPVSCPRVQEDATDLSASYSTHPNPMAASTSFSPAPGGGAVSKMNPTPGENYNLKYFEKSLLRSKETTL